MSEEDNPEMIEEQLADIDEEAQEERMETDQELREELSDDDIDAYGYPKQAENLDNIKFLKDVSKSDDTIRTSLLTKGELGVPLFSVRFYLKLEQMTRLRGEEKYGIIADYMRHKAFLTTDTGLSREGFLMGLAVTKRKETTKKRAIKEVKTSEKK